MNDLYFALSLPGRLTGESKFQKNSP